MAIKGVNPRYFAGMDAVALDPNAGKQNPAYAQMLNQAMQNRASEAARHRENDEENVFKARDRDQQARRDRNTNEISKRNAAVNEAGEKRLQGGQDFNHDRLKLADTEHLIDALQQAKTAHDDAAVRFFTDELQRRGYKGRALSSPAAPPPATPPPPAAPPPAAKPPIDRSPMPPRSPPPTASFPPAGEAESAPPMRGAPAGVGPRSIASFPPTNGAPPPGPAPAPRPPPAAAAAPPRPAAPQGAGWATPPAPNDDSAFFQAPFDRRGLEAGLDNVSRVLARPQAPPPPDRSVYGESAENFEQHMGGPQLSDTDLLNMAISKVVKSETGRDIQIPPTRSLLPARMLQLKGTP